MLGFEPGFINPGLLLIWKILWRMMTKGLILSTRSEIKSHLCFFFQFIRNHRVVLGYCLFRGTLLIFNYYCFNV